MLEQTATQSAEPQARPGHTPAASGAHSLSVVLPAYNEAQVIGGTICAACDHLSTWGMDFELIIVNDGSDDRTAVIVAALAATDARINLVSHPINQGYGAALVSGFRAATKELTFFMDADGQFDIADLGAFLPYIDAYDAVIGYRFDRRDSRMRKLNAWGWRLLVGSVLGVRMRDVDCAFKLLHTEFLRKHPLEARGAMINAELFYSLKRAGCTWKELPVRHLPRQTGHATGARPRIILRALSDLLAYAQRRRREEKLATRARILHPS